jgi:hypothetical protein
MGIRPGFLSFTLLSLVLINAAYGQKRTCAEKEAKQAESFFDSSRNWDSMHKFYRQFAQCDDGAIAEGVSDAVARLLAEHWDALGKLVRISRRDEGFEEFVLRHVDESIDWSDTPKIHENAELRCPSDAKRLCGLLINKTGAMLRQAEKQTPVKSAGETVIAGSYTNLAIRVKIAMHEVIIGKPSDGRPEAIRSNCTYSRYPCSVVDYIDINVNGKSIFVPRSAFSDLADLNSAEIYASKESATLMLFGGDASESYTLKILFNAERVKGRILIAGEFGDVLQKTTYFQVEH